MMPGKTTWLIPSSEVVRALKRPGPVEEIGDLLAVVGAFVFYLLLAAACGGLVLGVFYYLAPWLGAI